MYEVTVKKSFFASHYLRNVTRGVESPHDHHWVIEVKIKSEKTDASGCVIDFRQVDNALIELTNLYQGRVLNETGAFTKESPSAENIARHFFDELSKLLNIKKDVCLISVSAWEDNEHGATYTP
jgi:6-pyruvoyltetrahydropterin/6-carboxytetrahydropterin synthase